MITARRVKTPRFIIAYTQKNGVKGPKISVSVSKKVAPLAVKRNGIRRKVYAGIPPLLKYIPATTLVLVSVVDKAFDIKREEITQDLKKALISAGIYKS